MNEWTSGDGYILIRSKRRTVSVEISKDGEVVVRAPKRLALYEIERFVKKNTPWIRKHLEKYEERKKNAPEKEIPDENEIEALKKEARAVIPGRVFYYACMMGVTYGRITIRQQKTVWGSCSAKGNLSFNCLLMKAPDRVRDYVVVHELCHILHMDHSAQFWKCVASVIPDHMECRRWLREAERKYF